MTGSRRCHQHIIVPCYLHCYIRNNKVTFLCCPQFLLTFYLIFCKQLCVNLLILNRQTNKKNLLLLDMNYQQLFYKPKALPLGHWQISYQVLLNMFEYFRHFNVSQILQLFSCRKQSLLAKIYLLFHFFIFLKNQISELTLYLNNLATNKTSLKETECLNNLWSLLVAQASSFLLCTAHV